MHISLDSALGRQRRLNQVGETISSIATPTAAYSLRSLTGGDPKVVRVRRESDNDEQDFTASEVASGAMLSYVNTQAIKPLDIKELTSGGTDDGRNGNFILADAAYSLRSLGTRQATVTATGDTVARDNGKYVVQVRRNVNGDQKSFTADEVSDGTLVSFVNESFTSSLPLDVQSSAAAYSLRKLKTGGTSVTSSGDTGGDTTGDYVVQVRRSSDGNIKSFTADGVTDGTLISFVNEDLGITFGTAEATTNGATLTNASNTGFTYTSSDTSKRGIRLPFSQPIPPGATISVTITTSNKTPGITPSVKFARDATNQLGDSADPTTLTFDSTGTQTLVGKTTLTTTSLAFFDDVAGSFDISNVVINSIVYDGFVEKWYDQSGNGKNAVQTTPANQPKIVENGAVLVDSGGKPEIDFNGSDQFLAINFGSNLSQPNTIFMVHQSDTTNAADNEFFDETGTTGQRTLLDIDTGGGNYRILTGTTAFTTNQGIDTNKNLIGAFYDGASSYLSKNGTVSSTGDVGSQSIASTSTIGFSEGVTAYYDGTMQEFIIYGSNQSTKRRAIEESISGHYGITLGSFSRDGFVRTWYDQSVTGQDATTGTPNNNHVTQGTASAQPKIVENGSLLTPGVKFEGAQTLSASDRIITAASSGTYSAFSVQTVATSEAGYLYGNASGSNGTSIYALSTPTFTISNTSATNLDNITRSSGQNLLSAVYNSGDAGLLVNGAGTMSNSGTYNFSAGLTDGSNNFIIGNRNNSSADAAFLTGSINEIIVYNSNQSANRTAIEANIGSAYSIDLPSGVDPGFDQVNGFVERWYDQFGNNDAVQTTATEQPKIVSSGSLITGGGIAFDGSDDQLDFTALNASDLAIFTVLKFDAVSSQKRILGDSSDNSEGFGIGNATNGFFRGNGGSSLSPSLGATISTSGDFLYSLTRASDTITFFTKGTASGTNTRSDAFKADSIGGSTNPVDGNLKEIIIYTSDQSSNRLAIEANITSHYGIS